MKVLLDACVPRPLRSFLAGHIVRVAQEMGWGQLKNGVLLGEAELEFDAFITTDQNMKYQQRVVGRKLAILVLPTMTGRRFALEPGKSLPKSKL